MSALPLADLTATATLVLAAAALVLALAAVALVLAMRAATADGWQAARTELAVLRRQLAAGYRPLLVDVLATAPAPDDMDARIYVAQPQKGFDPRTVFVDVEAGEVSISVPLRNVGGGLAVIDLSGIGVSGPGLGEPQYRVVQRGHVPVDETTRIEMVAVRAKGEPIATGTAWELRVPYADFAGAQRTVVSLQLVCRGDDAQGPWIVERVDQETAGAPQLFEARDPAADEQTAGEPAPWVDDVPAPDSSAPKRGVRDEPVVDVWGNPVTKPRRGSRR